MSSCALIPVQSNATRQLEFLATALDAAPDQRERIWRHVRKPDGSREAELRAALMQSLPGHSGYDPATARRRLLALRGQAGADEGVAAVAQLRLADMRSDDSLRDENQALRQRLSQLVDIERSMATTDR